MPYDDAVQSLYQAPVDQFVSERKRLAGELKAAGDKEAAARFAKLARPPISAWVVNQLWWQVRPAFAELFETAQRLRDGKLDAMAAHREAIAKLRAQAIKILTAAEHGATEGTLRKVTQTLAALAATGGWAPDAPGALAVDRDPPGFEAIGIGTAPSPEPPSPKRAPEPTHDAHAAEREAAAARAEAAAEARRVEAERARRAAERHRLDAALRTAQGDVGSRAREVTRLERELAAAQAAVVQAQAVVEDLAQMIAKLDV